MGFRVTHFSSQGVVNSGLVRLSQIGLAAMLAGCPVDERDLRAPDASLADGSPDVDASLTDLGIAGDGAAPDVNTGSGGDDASADPDASSNPGDTSPGPPRGDSEPSDAPSDANPVGSETGTSVDSAADASRDPRVAPPRPVAPLSTATVTRRRPTLRWALPADTQGAHVEVCRDRGCANVRTTFDAAGSSSAPSEDLAPGVYFWRAYGKSTGATGEIPSPVWQFTVGAVAGLPDGGLPLDSSWGTTKDVHGDGYSDIVVGGCDANAKDGRAYFYSGGPSDVDAAPGSFLNPPPGDVKGNFAWSVASAGDVDGDGYADILVGAPRLNSSVGRAYLFRGGPSGPAAKPAILLAPEGGSFGSSVSAAGDFDGDGYGDVVVGAPDANEGRGRAYIFSGSADGLKPTASRILQAVNVQASSFGKSVAGAGDVNGDGLGDVIAAASSEAIVFLFLGSSAEPAAPTYFVLAVPEGANENNVAAAGDVNGDGYSDFVAAAPRWNDATGRVLLYLGGADGPKASTILDGSDGKKGWFGSAMAPVDFNGDGYGDLVVGAFGPTAPTGRAYLYLGGAEGLTNKPIALTTPGETIWGYGFTVASAGDVNRDGFSDIVVGAQHPNGKVYLYRGVSKPSSTLLPTTILDSVDVDSYFGASLASVSSSLSRRFRRTPTL